MEGTGDLVPDLGEDDDSLIPEEDTGPDFGGEDDLIPDAEPGGADAEDIIPPDEGEAGSEGTAGEDQSGDLIPPTEH